MTPRKLAEAARELSQEIGVEANVVISVGCFGQGYLSGSIYPHGIVNDQRLSIYVEDWDDLIPALRTAWAEHQEAFDRQKTDALALEIIRITHEQGECTDAALRVEFRDKEIDKYGERACEVANEMAAGGPFQIMRLAGANAA